MGLLDDTLRQLRGDNASQPLLNVLQELLTGATQCDTAGGSRQQQAQTPRAATAQQAQDAPALPGGLGGLLAQLQQAGLDDVVRSWVGSGENKPVQPDALGDALGRNAVSQMADKAGCNTGDLLAQLARALPGLIDQLTHDGRIPTDQEINRRLMGR